MKKLLSLLILLSACQKEEITKPEKSGDLHAVTFNLSGFSRHTEPMSVKLKAGKTTPPVLTADDPNDPSLPCYPDCPGSRYDFDPFYEHEIKYFAYNEETGELVSSQISSFDNGENKDYGKFTDSLPAGNYDIVFAMCQGDVSPFYDWGNTGPAIYYRSDFNEATLRGYESGVGGGDFSIMGVPDIFLKHIKLEVSGDVVMDDIKLPRVVGGLDIRLTDETFPDDLYYLINKHDTNSFIEFNGGAGGPSSTHYTYYNVEQSDAGYCISGYIITDSETGKLTTDVVLTAHRNSGDYYPGDTIAHKIIQDVEIEAGKKTILTGKLFDDQDPAQAFTVKIDTAWNGEIEVNF